MDIIAVEAINKLVLNGTISIEKANEALSINFSDHIKKMENVVDTEYTNDQKIDFDVITDSLNKEFFK